MMTNQHVVDFVTTKMQPVTSYLPESYQLRLDRRWIWLQRIAVWILRKLGCFAVTTDYTFIRHTLDKRNLMDAIIAQHAEIVSLYHKRGERVLIGSEDFRELSRLYIEHPYSFTLDYGWGEQTPHGTHHTVCGMKITVVPWMKGILVVPKEF